MAGSEVNGSANGKAITVAVPRKRRRRGRVAFRIKERNLRARWIEAESLRLHLTGLSFPEVAEVFIRVASALAKPVDQRDKLDQATLGAVTTPQGFNFPPDYRISRQAVLKAAMKALHRIPDLEADIYRKIDGQRIETMFMRLQPMIAKGDPRAVGEAVRAMAHRGKLLGYFSDRQAVEISGKNGKPIEIKSRNPLPPKSKQLDNAFAIAMILREVGALPALEPPVDDVPPAAQNGNSE